MTSAAAAPLAPAGLEAVALAHLPAGYAVHAALFTDVANAAFLHSQLVARNADFEYALIDASAVLSRTHVLAAVFKAVWAHASGALKTPNVHSETVLSLSPSLNITEAYRRYGISPAARHVVVVKILHDADAAAAAAVWSHLSANVDGTAAALTDANLAVYTDTAKVRKYLKLNGAPALAAVGADSPAGRKEAELLALGALALRGL